jgi:hypothetical protein
MDVVSGVAGTIQIMGQAAVRVRLDVNDAQAGLLWRAAGARRFAHNWAVATIKANADQWHAEATYHISKPDRVRPLTYFDLAKLWTAAKPTVAPWADEHSTWAFLYGIQAAAEAHKAFLKRQRRFPRFKSRHRSPSATACVSRAAGSGWRSTAGCGLPHRAIPRRSCGGWSGAATPGC